MKTITGMMAVLILGRLALAAEGPAQLAVKLEMPAEVDLAKPGKARVKCIIKNVTMDNLDVPASYGWTVRLLMDSGETWPLCLGSGAKPAAKPATIRLAPGKEHVVFDLPLGEILGNGNDPPDRKLWRWDWGAHPAPPAAPLKGRSRVTFWVEVVLKGNAEKSAGSVLKVKKP